jgi:peptidoglycan/LPS O-acetylase OafA/YrhL
MGVIPAPPGVPRAPRYYSLDLWRGVACLLVVLHHATIYAPAYRQAERGEALAANAATWLVAATTRMWVGVPLFFVISGYCISATADSSRRRPRALVRYFTRRFRRIYPPYWVLLGLLAVFVIVLDGLVPGLLADDYAGIPPPWRLSVGQWFGNLTLTESWRRHLGGGPVGYFNGMAWTLCYEEQFYAVVGLMLTLAPRRFFTGAAVVTALTAGLYALVRNRGALDGFFFDGYWIHFAAGIVVYYRINYATGWRARAANLLLLAGLLGFAWKHFLVLHAHSNVGEGGVVACAFALLLSFSHPWDRRLASARAARPLLFCGQICYSLYLVHWPVVKAVGHGLYLLGVRGDTATVLITVPVGVAASVLLAWGFFRLCERRFLNTPAATAPQAAAPNAAPPGVALTPATVPARSPG